MPKARKHQISLEDTQHYHCVSRCVRRSFLCGRDQYSGKSYEHRRQWVEDRLLVLSEVFAIEVEAFAVMSNHTHVVLYVAQERAVGWSLEEVLSRWHRLFSGTSFTRRYLDESERQRLADWEMALVERQVEVYRARLADISWFMRSLNEYIARKANREDQCSGRFWEGRFRSQALLDEQALLACMAYVDLNPVRSRLAPTPEQSNHTSIRLRIQAAIAGRQPERLRTFCTAGNSANSLPCHLNDYLQLLDITARALRTGNSGYLAADSPPLLVRLGIEWVNWLELTQGFEYQFGHLAGRISSLRECRPIQRLQRVHGAANAERLLG